MERSRKRSYIDNNNSRIILGSRFGPRSFRKISSNLLIAFQPRSDKIQNVDPLSSILIQHSAISNYIKEKPAHPQLNLLLQATRRLHLLFLTSPDKIHNADPLSSIITQLSTISNHFKEKPLYPQRNYLLQAPVDSTSSS